MKTEIRTPQSQSEWERYYEIRFNELRKPWRQPKGSEKDLAEDSAFHYALFIEAEMVGVLRMDLTDQPDMVQFRFMAIDNHFQGKKLGELLMKHAEMEAAKINKRVIMLHAREKALSFYEKLGFNVIEKSHLLFNTIQHYKMLKKI